MYKIAVVGPESTGKSELAQQLAQHYGSPWVPEYARTYIENLSQPYTFDDVSIIARKQIELELSFEQNNKSAYVFFDTDLIITKVWFEYRFQHVPDFVNERLNTGFFDLYLLCEPDLPWQPDPVREHGDDRDYFFDWYKTEIEKLGKPYCSIHGIDNQRLINAVTQIDHFIKQRHQGAS